MQPFLPRSLAAQAARVELRLRLPDGAPWVLSVSAGVERFIGPYPRLGGIMSDGPLLEFETVQPART